MNCRVLVRTGSESRLIFKTRTGIGIFNIYVFLRKPTTKLSVLFMCGTETRILFFLKNRDCNQELLWSSYLI
jgi:hypothetical protein